MVDNSTLAIKQSVDRDRRAGRFLLTGSANALFVPTVADSLAGRMEMVRLLPLSEVDIAHRPPTFLDRLFAADFKVAQCERLGPQLADLIIRGGFPEAVRRDSERSRRIWVRDYLDWNWLLDRRLAWLTSARWPVRSASAARPCGTT